MCHGRDPFAENGGGRHFTRIVEFCLCWPKSRAALRCAALALALDLALDLDLRDFRRPSRGLAEGGDGHGCPSSAEAPWMGPAARTPGSKAGAREPRSAA
ncbi:hypothetical protein DW66_1867 [Pseudomonas putida]|nr:hypothetical protein DW66_1867 [Pseudomonas putida]